ncbi:MULTISPECIES: hypothetical protein [unclassified Moorena]|nr:MULTISPECIES: hypothetical protein [unclassified Moorena]
MRYAQATPTAISCQPSANQREVVNKTVLVRLVENPCSSDPTLCS